MINTTVSKAFLILMIANTVFTRQLNLLHLEITRANMKRFPKHKFSDVGIRKQN